MASIPNPSGNQDVALVLAGGNAVGAYLAGVPSDLAPKSVKTTMAGISWMWRSHYIW